MTHTAWHATIATPPGPFTVVVSRDADGRDVVLAGGWTGDVSALLPVIHRSLRPAWVERADSLDVMDVVERSRADALELARAEPDAPPETAAPDESPSTDHRETSDD